MSGKSYLLDTNAIIALLRGHKGLLRTLKKAQWVGISVISVFEFLSFRELSTEDKTLFEEFYSRVHVIDIESADAAMIKSVITLRKTANLKLPDAIIAAAAVKNGATLITQDQDFHSVKNITILQIKA